MGFFDESNKAGKEESRVATKEADKSKAGAHKQEPEIWDAYYADGTLAGRDLIRGEAVPEGLRHAVSEVFVMHEDGSILLMRRDFNKPNYPGFWECGAGGSVLKGESFIDGARRELQEETGITATDLEEIYRAVTEHTIYRGYFCVTDIPKGDIQLQAGETIDFRWVSKQEFMEFFYSEQYPDGPRKRLEKFVARDFQKELYDCGFLRGKYWFRYRAAAIIIEDGAVLMARNDVDDYYYTIGGGVHLGETSEQAVIREVYEETGVHYEVDHLAFVNECLFYGHGSLAGKECHEIEFYYLMKPRGTRELHSNSTTLGGREYMCWLPIDRLHEYKEFPLFFRDKLKALGTGVEHIVSDERGDG